MVKDFDYHGEFWYEYTKAVEQFRECREKDRPFSDLSDDKVHDMAVAFASVEIRRQMELPDLDIGD